MAPLSPLRQLLWVLRRDSLLVLADSCEVALSQRREVDTILSELWSKRARLTPDKVLAGLGSLPRPELLEVCQDLSIQVSPTARKQIFVEELRSFLAVSEKKLPREAATEDKKPGSKKIFVVHGHDGAMRNDVVRFLSNAGLEPVVLAEQASGGATVIEKLEEYMNECSRAVILFSPDDIGHVRAQESAKMPRARQNVIFEFGMAIGMLGRKNVILLYRKPVEIPTDIGGLVYIQYEEDSHDYQVRLAKELKRKGFDIDLNSVL
jgi:predicted nucleotide-binding protein